MSEGFSSALSTRLASFQLVDVTYLASSLADPADRLLARAELRQRCRHCPQRKPDHGPDGKCLFESTYFEAVDA